MNPAMIPHSKPNVPAIGARVVESNRVNIGAGSFNSHIFKRLAMYTPSIIGKIFLICFPVALNPTIQKIEPIVGPFKSPFKI